MRTARESRRCQKISPECPLSVLACSVRGCGLPLTRRDRALVCSAGHSFDIARSGYVNLLQPQDRRSLVAGDSKAAVDARAALEQAGVGRAIVDAVIHTTAALLLPADAIVIDLGSGSGEMLGGLSQGAADLRDRYRPVRSRQSNSPPADFLH